MAGAQPVFADIDAARLTIDPSAVEAAITPRTRAIVPVHLYGQAADMAAIERVAAAHDLAIVEDCCQAHLAHSAGRLVGNDRSGGRVQLLPDQEPGCLGDGGAVVTGDAALAKRISGCETADRRIGTIIWNSA
jgi:dTDP-4-amino-4,6-dideoxygalactose transaminase